MKLDIKDKRILSELELNGRIGLSALGKKVGVSKQVVQYRINKLESANIIQGYNAVINTSKIGQTIYLVYLKLVRITSANEKKWMDEISKDKNVLGIGKNAGHWDLTIILQCPSNNELDSALKRIVQNRNANIKEKLITTEIESQYFPTKILYDTKNNEITTSSSFERIFVDDTDLALLNILASDGRATLLQLAKELNMSPNGIKNRIKNLESRNVILGYKTKINFEQLGYLHFRVFLHLNSFSTDLYNKMKSFLKNEGNVESVTRMVGYADLDFRCYVTDITSLYALISKIKDTFVEEIAEVNSMPIFGWDKMKYFSGEKRP